MPAPVKLRVGDLVLQQGQLHQFSTYHPLQRAVLPILAFQHGVMKGLGTAVCIGPGWFVTAKHVVEEHYELFATDPHAPSGLFVYIQTDERPASDPDAILGDLLAIDSVNLHSETDLATMSSSLPNPSSEWLRTLPLALRMPEVGEPIAIAGYPTMGVESHAKPGLPLTVIVDPHFSVSVGEVLHREAERRFQSYRGSPGFESDAPSPSGMSGGAVIDSASRVVGFLSSAMEIGGETPGWSSYTAAVGPVLELNLASPDPDQAEPLHVARLVAEGHIECDVFPNFAVDEQGNALYTLS